MSSTVRRHGCGHRPSRGGEQAIRVDFAPAWAGLALPPSCVIKPLSIGYHPRKPRHRGANDGLVHASGFSRTIHPGPHGPVWHDVQSLRCMTPSRNLTALAFRAAVPLVRIHLPPVLSLCLFASGIAATQRSFSEAPIASEDGPSYWVVDLHARLYPQSDGPPRQSITSRPMSARC